MGIETSYLIAEMALSEISPVKDKFQIRDQFDGQFAISVSIPDRLIFQRRCSSLHSSIWFRSQKLDNKHPARDCANVLTEPVILFSVPTFQVRLGFNQTDWSRWS